MLELRVINKNKLTIAIHDRDEFDEYISNIDLDNYNDYDVLCDMLDYEICNGGIYMLDASDFGMTDSSNFCFTTDWSYEDDENIRLYNLYHDPNYAIHDYIRTLIDFGELELECVIFDENDDGILKDDDGNLYTIING